MRVWRFESSREWSVAAWLHSGLRVERGNQVVHGSETEVRQLSWLTRPSSGNRRRVLSVAETSTPYQRQRKLSTSGGGESCRLQEAELI